MYADDACNVKKMMEAMLMEKLKNKKIIGAIVIGIIAIIIAVCGFGRSYEDVIDDYFTGMATLDAEKVVSAYHEDSLKLLGLKNREVAAQKLQAVFDIVKEKGGGQLDSKYEIIDVRGNDQRKKVMVLVTNYIDFKRGLVLRETTRIVLLNKINGKWYLTDEYDGREER